MGVAALAGLRAGLVASFGAFALTNWFLTPPLHTLTISESENVVALSVFVLVTVVISVLVDRAARRSREAASARADAAALARSAATLVGALDPLADLLEQVRATFGLDAASVLERNGDGWWPTHTSGTPELLDPAQGTSIDLSADGALCLVVSGATLQSEQLVVLRAFADQLAMAVEARRLRADAAEADLVAEADALRSALLQAVSHDFRTPLATIKASASGLLHTDVAFTDDDRRVLLHDIEAASDRLDRMVRDLLDMSRLQAGAVDLDLRCCRARRGRRIRARRNRRRPGAGRRRRVRSVAPRARRCRAARTRRRQPRLERGRAGRRTTDRCASRPDSSVRSSTCGWSTVARVCPRRNATASSSRSNDSATGRTTPARAWAWRSPRGSSTRWVRAWSLDDTPGGGLDDHHPPADHRG